MFELLNLNRYIKFFIYLLANLPTNSYESFFVVPSKVFLGPMTKKTRIGFQEPTLVAVGSIDSRFLSLYMYVNNIIWASMTIINFKSILLFSLLIKYDK
jgi:hypothetical protein